MTTPPGTHVPVLLDAVLAALRPPRGGRIIDATVGGGGHARALLERLGPTGAVLGLDRDPLMLDRLRAAAAGEPVLARLQLVHSSFSRIVEVAQREGFTDVDGILLDLGLSSHHLETSGRGFSFERDEPLDLRFDPTEDARPTAAALLRRTPADALAHLIFTYGEERYSRRIARHLVRERGRRRIETATALRDVVLAALPPAARRFGRRSVARVFQAVRIAVNAELDEIERALPELPGLVRPGGRIAVIAFHSLEDRLVKQSFRAACAAGTLLLVTKKPIRADDSEIACNSRAASARLRVAERPATSSLMD
jgi:16S rRNA (cytosine1402-N4)-methyltransferase